MNGKIKIPRWDQFKWSVFFGLQNLTFENSQKNYESQLNDFDRTQNSWQKKILGPVNAYTLNML